MIEQPRGPELVYLDLSHKSQVLPGSGMYLDLGMRLFITGVYSPGSIRLLPCFVWTWRDFELYSPCPGIWVTPVSEVVLSLNCIESQVLQDLDCLGPTSCQRVNAWLTSPDSS